MELITRDIDAWLKLFCGLNQLKKEYESKIITEVIIILEKMKNNKISLMSYHTKLLNLFYEFHLDDIDLILELLSVIQSFYSYDNVIAKIKDAEEKYNIDGISFIVQGINSKKVIDTYFVNYAFKKVYCPKDVIPREYIDFTTNGLNKVIINSDKPFIVDERDLYHDKKSTYLYTSDFNLNCELLPLKEEMDLFRINYERDALFQLLLDSLEGFYLAGKMDLIIDKPNISYRNDFVSSFEKRQTIRSDGKLFGDNCELLYPSKMDYLTGSKIMVQEANFVVIAKVNNKVIDSIQLVVDRDYINYLNQSNNQELITKLNRLKCGEQLTK